MVLTSQDIYSCYFQMEDVESSSLRSYLEENTHNPRVHGTKDNQINFDEVYISSKYKVFIIVFLLFWGVGIWLICNLIGVLWGIIISSTISIIVFFICFYFLKKKYSVNRVKKKIEYYDGFDYLLSICVDSFILHKEEIRRILNKCPTGTSYIIEIVQLLAPAIAQEYSGFSGMAIVGTIIYLCKIKFYEFLNITK